MKKLLLSLVLTLAVSAAVSAQDRMKSAELRAKTAQVTRMMAQQLKLNESDYIRLRSLNEDRLMKTEKVALQYKNDAETKDAKLKEIEQNFDQQVSGMLTANQLSAYKEFKLNPPVSYTALMNEEAGTSR